MNVVDQAMGRDWALYNGDSAEVLAGLPDNSVDLAVFSPPFQALYVYSPTERDLGNCRSSDEFFDHMHYITSDLTARSMPQVVQPHSVLDRVPRAALSTARASLSLRDNCAPSAVGTSPRATRNPHLTPMCCSVELDNDLRRHLDGLSEGESEYWSFRNKAAREHAHSYFQYPAMMVPQMQAKLVWAVLQVLPHAKTVYDPFMGSGTVLGEAMMQGLGFAGCDINPLAVLLCRAKSGPFHVESAKVKAVELQTRIASDARDSIDVEFPNRDKWFRADVSIALSRARRAILGESELWFRQFVWVALAETVRLTSNSRTSTYKLHARPQFEIRNRQLDPIKLFAEILSRNLENMERQYTQLAAAGLVENGEYVHEVAAHHRDARTPSAEGQEQSSTALYDIMVTSPPYGDNTSTVPYGQHSYLPLQWIEFSDIDPGMDRTWLSTTHEIDRRSLGGVKQDALVRCADTKEKSPSFANALADLKHEKRDRSVRVAAFCLDLDACLDPILAQMEPNAYLVWTVGNRTVGKRRIPLDDIVVELLEARGATCVHKIPRLIPTKRQAEKNSYAETMSTETVLVMRKGVA